LTKKPTFLSVVLAEVLVSTKRIRDFGLVMLVVLSFIIPAFLIWRSGWEPTTAAVILFCTGLLLFVMSLVRPAALTGIYKAWMGLAIILGLFMTKVIISLVFYLLMTPIGLGRQLLVGDPLGMRKKDTATTYWTEKNITKPDPASYEKQY